jgi:2-amino-4-hydroxy-6-hydroxymethyldihydropteridine diphosphokinase
MNAFIAFGSNLGDRLQNFSEARRQLTASPNIELLTASPIYEAEAVGCPLRTRPFLNAVVQIETTLTPFGLLNALQQIEETMGRAPARPKNVPRRIDLDLLACDALILQDPRLTLPHPELTKRRFVLRPLADIAPDYIVAGTDKTVRDWLTELKDTYWIKPFADHW